MFLFRWSSSGALFMRRATLFERTVGDWVKTFEHAGVKHPEFRCHPNASDRAKLRNPRTRTSVIMRDCAGLNPSSCGCFDLSNGRSPRLA
jgi:hypothetical protein